MREKPKLLDVGVQGTRKPKIMDGAQERKLYEDIGGIKANQENVCERIDSLTKILIDRSEKWDKAAVVSEANDKHLNDRSPVWDTAATRAAVMNKVVIGVTTATIAGGIAFAIFR